MSNLWVAPINSPVHKNIFFTKLNSSIASQNTKYYADTVRTVRTSWVETFTDIRRVRLGATRSSNGITPNSFMTAAQKINGFVLFNRLTSDEEYMFFLSNKNGGGLQSNIGVLVDIRCNEAEILDFSTLQDGSDMRVGVRDYSGNNHHGQIMNLPAGSLEDKLAYANANLFVPFIQ